MSLYLFAQQGFRYHEFVNWSAMAFCRAERDLYMYDFSILGNWIGNGLQYYMYNRPCAKFASGCECECVYNTHVSTYVMQFVVESAGVAHRFAALVSAPKCRRRRFAVGTRGSRPACSTLQRL